MSDVVTWHNCCELWRACSRGEVTPDGEIWFWKTGLTWNAYTHPMVARFSRAHKCCWTDLHPAVEAFQERLLYQNKFKLFDMLRKIPAGPWQPLPVVITGLREETILPRRPFRLRRGFHIPWRRRDLTDEVLEHCCPESGMFNHRSRADTPRFFWGLKSFPQVPHSNRGFMITRKPVSFLPLPPEMIAARNARLLAIEQDRVNLLVSHLHKLKQQIKQTTERIYA